jgi:hypothetical protein
MIRKPNFTMKETLNMVEDDVRMLMNCREKVNKPNLMILLGPAGLKKTTLVRETLRNMNVNYAYVRGEIKSPTTLYKLLFQHRDAREGKSVLVIDDSDQLIKKNSKFMSMLLAITDKGNNRRISCLNNFDSDIKSTRNPEGRYPQSFIFNGTIICISNLPITKLDQAFRSRAVINVIEASSEAVIDEVERDKENHYPEIEEVIKNRTIKFLREVVVNFPDYRIDFRTYQKALEYFDNYSKDKAEAIIVRKIEQGII